MPELPSPLRLQPAGPLGGTLAAPGSKSHTNRALVVAALADGDSRLLRPLLAQDTARMIGGLRGLGVDIVTEAGAIAVRGTGGLLGLTPAGQPGGQPGGQGGAGDQGELGLVIDAGDSGTTLRFLTALATLAGRSVTLTGSEGLRARPIGPLVSTLRQMGCKLGDQAGLPPVTVSPGSPRGGRVGVDAATSSQYASAVLLVSPYADGDVEVLASRLGAAGYVDMTVSLMQRWGASVRRSGDAFVVGAGHHYQGQVEHIAGDASAAAHLFALAVASEGSLTVTNLAAATDQPDIAILEVLTSMGVAWRWEGPDAVVVHGPSRLRPVAVDLAKTPDLLPVLAVLASLAPGRSVLSGLGVTRYHETDRVTAVATELARLGVGTELGGPERDALVIHGGAPHGEGVIRTYGDHRMAMAFAALGARLTDISIEDPGCVAKTYPEFWEDARALGLRWTPPA